MTVLLEPFYNVALNPRIAPACSKFRALYGIHSHIVAFEDAPEIQRKSTMQKDDGHGFHLWSTPLGTYWIPEQTDDSLFLLLGQQQRDVYDEWEASVKPGDVVLDCGAHVGVFTRTALRHGARLIVAIEPAPENVECLRRNFAQEVKDGRVIVYPKGVWNKDDVLPLHVCRNSAGDSVTLDLDPGQEVVNVPLTTIDKVVAELHLTRVDFIKMDIKGSEKEALQGAAHTLANYQPRMSVASEHYATDAEMIPRIVLAANPRYHVECGSCIVDNGVTRPEVLHFY